MSFLLLFFVHTIYMQVFKLIFIFVGMTLLIISNVYQYTFRKVKNIRIISCINILISILIIVFNLSVFISKSSINYLLYLLFFVLSYSVFVNSFLIKNYQEIDFNFNIVSLTCLFGILTIVFGNYIVIYTKMGDCTFEGLIILITCLILFAICQIANVNFTKQVMELIDYSPYLFNNTIEKKKTIVVRTINFNNKILKVSYVKNQNYKTINRKCNLKIFFYFTICLIIIII